MSSASGSAAKFASNGLLATGEISLPCETSRLNDKPRMAATLCFSAVNESADKLAGRSGRRQEQSASNWKELSRQAQTLNLKIRRNFWRSQASTYFSITMTGNPA